MIFIVVRWTVRPEYSPTWLERIDAFTQATRAEPGNLFFDWSRSVDNPHQYTLVEAFADGDAGAAHVGSAHFAEAMAWLPDVVADTPEIINVTLDASGWSRMAEVTPR